MGIAGAVVAGVVVAGVVVTMPDGVEGPGAMLAELQGHRRTAAYETTADAPADLVPGWATGGTDVISVRPGEDATGDRGNRRVEMTWDGTLPDCTDMPRRGCRGTAAWTDDTMLAGA